MWSDRRLQQIVYMEKMKLGFDNRWLLPPPLQQNLSSVGCSRAGVGRPSLCVRARVYSLSLLSLSSRSLTQEAAAGGFRRVFGALRRGGQPQRSTSVRAKVAGVVGVYLDAQNVHYRSDKCSPPPPPRKAPKTRRKPPAAASCVKMRELKLKRESE